MADTHTNYSGKLQDLRETAERAALERGKAQTALLQAEADQKLADARHTMAISAHESAMQAYADFLANGDSDDLAIPDFLKKGSEKPDEPALVDETGEPKSERVQIEDKPGATPPPPADIAEF